MNMMATGGTNHRFVRGKDHKNHDTKNWCHGFYSQSRQWRKGEVLMVFVLNKNKQPLNPCTPARSRILLKQGKAVIHKKYPFTIRLKELKDVSNNQQVYQIKFDPWFKSNRRIHS